MYYIMPYSVTKSSPQFATQNLAVNNPNIVRDREFGILLSCISVPRIFREVKVQIII